MSWRKDLHWFKDGGRKHGWLAGICIPTDEMSKEITHFQLFLINYSNKKKF